MENYSIADGQIELDLLGEKNNTRYILEIKWKNKVASYKDLKKFVEKIEKAKFSQKRKRMFFVSKSGFSEVALKLARAKKIVALDRNLEEM